MIANIIIDIGGLLFDVDGSGFMLNEIYPKIDLIRFEGVAAMFYSH